MPALTSLQNSRVKLVRQLQQRREVREREGKFVAEGARLAADFLDAGTTAAFAFIGPSPAAQQWMHTHRAVECIEVNDTVMREVSLETTPPGVLVVFDLPHSSVDEVVTTGPGVVLILDALRNPGNLGACLRVAAGADCRHVLLAPGSVDPYNPKVVRGGMGAHTRIHVLSLSWAEISAVCHRRAVWAAEASGAKSYDQVMWTDPAALIIGGEASGISGEARKCATGTITIPLANRVESLNAAVACGVILFEAARQRRANLSR
ncbi:MAG: RNA methyltransferase [Chloroflexi bacterium]|nr:RNA methyltransferase [Chloroflexota bacterium]